MDNNKNEKNEPVVVGTPQKAFPKKAVIIAGAVVFVLALSSWYLWNKISEVPPPEPAQVEQGEEEIDIIYGLSVETIGEPPVVYAGNLDLDLADFRIIESAVGSLLNNGSLTIELPTYVRWYNDGPFVTQEKGSPVQIDMKTRTNGNNGAMDNSRHVIEYKVTETTGQIPGVILFERNRVYIAIDAPEGDIEAIISGSGVREDIKVVLGEVVKPVTATGGKTNVVIGRQGQKVSDLVITEAEKGIFQSNPIVIDISATDSNKAASVVNNDGEILVSCPLGVTWAKTPDVKVEGDLRIDAGSVWVSTIGGRNTLTIRITDDSTKPSAIIISDIILSLDRTVPEGPLKMEISGAAIDRVSGRNNTIITDVEVANVITSAPVSSVNRVSVFIIDSSEYTVDGEGFTMDGVPYVKDGNAYIPANNLAHALDITDQNIIWSDSDQTITLMKGGSLAQLKIGGTQILINNVSVGMDAAPEIIEGQIMLPAAWVANAFGFNAQWDEAAQQLTISGQN